MPLRTLNPPHLRRVARSAALVHLKELQAVTAELLRIELEKAKAGKALVPEGAKREKRKTRA